jgi:hypothetical protein
MMKIPKYWARETQELSGSRGKPMSVTCWRWSDVSVEDARRRAGEHLADLARRIGSREDLDRYSYGDQPLREEVIRVITNGGDDETAVITRNAYGSLVLNAARAMFIDIDFEYEGIGSSLAGSICRLFGKKSISQEEKALQSIEQWAQGHREWGMRVYRTAAGLRCLVTHSPFEPTEQSSLNVLEGLGCDPLYVRLCRTQQCFRARLTPKPWRCGISRPPSRYPWDDPQDEIRYRHWEEQYQQVSSKYMTCRLIRELGDTAVHPDIQTVLATHDEFACRREDLKLA